MAAPGIIQSYNAATNTATVQLAIREKVNQMDGTTADTDLPLRWTAGDDAPGRGLCPDLPGGRR